MALRIDFNSDAVTAIYAKRAVDAAEELGTKMEEIAKREAPVGTGKTSRRPLVLRPLSEFPRGAAGSPKRERHQLAVELHGLSKGQLKRFVGKVPEVGPANRKLASFFRQISSGAIAGDISLGRRGAIVGGHRPGELKRSIKLTMSVDENRVTARVSANTPYAAAQEKGFRHYSHKKLTGFVAAKKPYLRPAYEAVADDWLSGKPLKR
jgi:hypothetical protein